MWPLFLFFLLGYACILSERWIKISRASIALLMGVGTWVLLLSTGIIPFAKIGPLFDHKIAFIAELVFFLLGAMIIVALMEAHDAFHIVLRAIACKSKRWLLIIVSLFSFFLSAILDNLTTMILMIVLLRSIFPKMEERFLPLCMVNLAANAGGAWTPIGDVTTTMLWIGGNITTKTVITHLFFPSLVAMLLPLCIFLVSYRGVIQQSCTIPISNKHNYPTLFLVLGIITLLGVPFFHALTGLAPCVGMIMGVGVLWFVSDFLDFKGKGPQVPVVLNRVDLASLLFFIGILLAIDAIDIGGILPLCAAKLQSAISNPELMAIIVGMITSLIGNVPMTAAMISMYPLAHFGTDHVFWVLLAYSAGVGGSLFLIGSAAGIALMTLEKIDIWSYARAMTIPALIGMCGGISVFLIFFS